MPAGSEMAWLVTSVYLLSRLPLSTASRDSVPLPAAKSPLEELGPVDLMASCLTSERPLFGWSPVRPCDWRRCRGFG